MMKNFTLKLMAAIIGATFLFSCQSSSDLTSSSILKKRRYNKGYQWNIKTPAANKTAESYASNDDARPNPTESIAVESPDVKAPTVEASPITASVEPISTEIAEPKANSETDVWTRSVEANPAYTKSPKTNNDRVDTEASRTAPRAVNHTNYGNAVMGTPVATPSDGSMLLYIILAILIPPLAVGLLYGIGTEFWISLILTLLFIIPGIVYALIMVLQY